jgi:Fe-S-cluster-containing dehydrogenase component
MVDREVCIGCMSCTVACPYGAPYIIDIKADKCDFCSHRLDKGLNPYCAEICPVEAIVFGDLGDSTSEVSKLVASGKAKSLCPEFGTRPNVYYIPPAWYETEWPKLTTNALFLEAMAARKKDLPTPETMIKTVQKRAVRTER